MKTRLLLLLTTAFMLSIQSCKKEAAEFVADDTTFADFKNWVLKETKNGIDPSLGTAHNGNDANSIREIYFKDGASRNGNLFPVGTVINKYTHNDTSSLEMYTGMVKRGGDFDPSANDWEYFILNANGTIAKDTDGSSLRGGSDFKACYSCHVGASSKDYIFTD